MTRRLTAICAAFLCVITMIALAEQQPQSAADDQPKAADQSEQDRWMMVKLTSAQQILADLTRGNFEDLETSARRMLVINMLEKWVRDEDFAKKSEYQGQLNAFEFSTKELIRNAQDRNTDGTLKAYISLTESCVRCHQLIRDGRTK